MPTACGLKIEFGDHNEKTIDCFGVQNGPGTGTFIKLSYYPGNRQSHHAQVTAEYFGQLILWMEQNATPGG